MSGAVEIVEAGAEDRPLIVKLMAALQDFERALEPNRLPGADCAEEHVAALYAWIEEEGGGVLLARETGAPDAPGEALGFVLYGVAEEFGRFVLPENQRFGQLSDLYVQETARGRGVGKALIREAERRLAALGVTRVEVSAVTANPTAIAAYEALGYRPSLVTLAKDVPSG